MKNKQLPELIWYGERGVINSILTHMQQSKTGFLEEVRKLIGVIQWADQKPADWAAGITCHTCNCRTWLWSDWRSRSYFSGDRGHPIVLLMIVPKWARIRQWKGMPRIFRGWLFFFLGHNDHIAVRACINVTEFNFSRSLIVSCQFR